MIIQKVVNNNPFLSRSYTSIWLKHFNSNRMSSKRFDDLLDLEFVKHKRWPMFVNVGETLTKGMSYELNAKADTELKNQTLLVYDVPTYFGVDAPSLKRTTKLLKSKQYPGFLIETSKYNSLNDYMLDHFSKNSRNKNNKYKRRLEDAFNVNYKMFFGDISKSEYDFVFDAFKRLLEKRFDDKQIYNNNLDPKEWQFYYEVAYTLILEKKASLFVIYDNDKPIGVTLSYFSDDILFDAITVFDIDYFKFHLGSVTIMKLIEWCIDNGIKNLDFSKGYFEYKTRWCTKTYDFEYHILYDSTSLKSKLIAASVKKFYDFKQGLRDKNVNEKLHKLTYKLKNKEQNTSEKVVYNFTETDSNEVDEAHIPINFELLEHRTIKLMVFEFLYLYQEHCNYIEVLALTNKTNAYYIKGKQKTFIATISSQV